MEQKPLGDGNAALKALKALPDSFSKLDFAEKWKELDKSNTSVYNNLSVLKKGNYITKDGWFYNKTEFAKNLEAKKSTKVTNYADLIINKQACKYMNLTDKFSISEISRLLGVDRKQVYRWTGEDNLNSDKEIKELLTKEHVVNNYSGSSNSLNILKVGNLIFTDSIIQIGIFEISGNFTLKVNSNEEETKA